MAEPQPPCLVLLIRVKLNVSDLQTNMLRRHHKPRQRLEQMQHASSKVTSEHEKQSTHTAEQT